MAESHVDPVAVLGDLKDFQRRTARWVFDRMFDEREPAVRFLVADEVGLGKTHVAKGVIAQVIDHLRRSGDQRHDIVYVCSNGAIARQNLRKLVPKGIAPLEDVERLTMLPLAELNEGADGQSGINLLAITPGTSLRFGHSTGRFKERCLAYTFLRALWGPRVMSARARWIFWAGVTANDPDARLQSREAAYRKAVQRSLADFAHLVEETDRDRIAHGQPTLRGLFDQLVEGLAWKRTFPEDLWGLRAELIGEVRRVMAIVGISALRPDLVVLDEFQRFKDLLQPDPSNFASEVAHQLFGYVDPDTHRQARTLLLSATPYRMYTTADEVGGDHYADFLSTCAFLYPDPAKVDRLKERFTALRGALTSTETLTQAESICAEIGSHLRTVMARTERLAATPNRDGMLSEHDAVVTIEPDDLRSFLRFGDLAQAVDHHEPTEYWKAGPYLVNFMEKYKLKESLDRAAGQGLLPAGERLRPGPGLLDWDEVEAYESIDPQNGRLRWLISDLDRHRAFELLWMPPSLRYYDTGSAYESEEAASFTKRLIFSGWMLVPKVVSSLVSFEAERRAYLSRSHRYTADYRRRGGQRLAFRTEARSAVETRAGEARSGRRPAAMTTFLLVWPSPTLAVLGNPRPPVDGVGLRPVAEVLESIEAKIIDSLAPLLQNAPAAGPIDQRWYWAVPLLLDQQAHPVLVDLLLGSNGPEYWEESPGDGFRAHHAEARALLNASVGALGRPPDDLAAVLAEVALGGPAVCALRAISAVTSLPLKTEQALWEAAWIAAAFRSYFNAPEVTGVVLGRGGEADSADLTARYWQDVVRHCIGGNLQALLDEHCHVLRDWLGHVDLDDEEHRTNAADDIAQKLSEALEVRTSSLRVDIPKPSTGRSIEMDEHRIRTRFAAAFGNQSLEDGGVARVESVSVAFNSPFWPFVLTSTSVGQEGLDFHLWCHSVVHWNLPANPVDLEQREGRVHRYKGHAVRRNVAAALGSTLLAEGLANDADPWTVLFERAATARDATDDEMVPYWVLPGPARIERLVPVFPFSQDAATLPRLRKTLAAYRLAFGQPRQEELIEYLGANHSDAELVALAGRLRIDLSPPPADDGAAG